MQHTQNIRMNERFTLAPALLYSDLPPPTIAGSLGIGVSTDCSIQSNIACSTGTLSGLAAGVPPKALSGAAGLRLHAEHKQNGKQQDADRCISPGRDPGGDGSRQPN